MMKEQQEKKMGIFGRAVIIALVILVVVVTCYYIYAAIDYYL